MEKLRKKILSLLGPGEAKKQFRDMLPIQLRKGVIAEVDVAIDDACGLVNETKEIMKEKRKEEHRSAP